MKVSSNKIPEQYWSYCWAFRTRHPNYMGLSHLSSQYIKNNLLGFLKKGESTRIFGLVVSKFTS